MYRTIEQTIQLLKKADPETAITKYFIRQLAKTEQIHTMNANKKVLIDCVSLQNFLGFTFIVKEAS